MGRVTLAWILPALGVETKEELQVLECSQSCYSNNLGDQAYPHRVSLRAIHIAQEEVPELDWIQSGEQ